MYPDIVPPISAEIVCHAESLHFNVRLHTVPRVGEEISVISQYTKHKEPDQPHSYRLQVQHIRHSTVTEELSEDPDWEMPSHYVEIEASLIAPRAVFFG